MVSTAPDRKPPLIGSLNESALHAAIKQWYARPGDALEGVVDGCVIDLIRGDLLVEVQTGNFASIRDKVRRLCARRKVRVVYPIPAVKWIVTLSGDRQTVLRRRKSPKCGSVLDVFNEMMRMPDMANCANFSLEALLIVVEEVRCDDGAGSWRRRGISIVDRRLLEVQGSAVFGNRGDYLRCLPDDMPRPFTSANLSSLLGIPEYRARRIAYTLRKMGAIVIVGKEGNRLVHDLAT
ncbi:MAG TPA: hypothetical protein PL033_06575 [Candidatus Brocadiia bacterium]|nr:hypothetical protein [Candidatus Brocadiia bacterium]